MCRSDMITVFTSPEPKMDMQVVLMFTLCLYSGKCRRLRSFVHDGIYKPYATFFLLIILAPLVNHFPEQSQALFFSAFRFLFDSGYRSSISEKETNIGLYWTLYKIVCKSSDKNQFIVLQSFCSIQVGACGSHSSAAGGDTTVC